MYAATTFRLEHRTSPGRTPMHVQYDTTVADLETSTYSLLLLTDTSASGGTRTPISTFVA